MYEGIVCSCLQATSLEHADTEDGIATPVFTCSRLHPTSSTTSVDVLQVGGAWEKAVSWTEKVDHDSLIHLFGVHPQSSTSISAIGNTI